MNENQFLRTMIETIKYDDVKYKDELLGILRNSIIKFDKSSDFTRKSYQYWEDIDLRVPIPMLKRARELRGGFYNIAKDIYIQTEEFDLRTLNIKPKPIDLDKDEYKEHDVVFDEIKDTIIQGIREAKYTIWIAVAWFTDKEIFEELILRQNAGIDIRVITSDEPTNRYLMDQLEENFNTVKVPQQGYNRLHDKFCIIDFEFVMHGSYNWSKAARMNEETLATAIDKDLVRKFSDEFMRLYNEYK
ncbi:DUF1669 domain-containing protein [Clostridium botulinum]|uniref:phospholipase D n=1 Tax=Clostridium botulinum TaxID=1491 RepID=A0A6G4CTR5_CLOBO|nr:DUF1669 domain-containing protein [Clostridium botulinum]NEZ98385.1 DUF1669 domain-containing protein [Clostridium botulinum]NFA30056.1 DUF1669 domain-containing protein [Clostridium botulinum]NFA86444.1 DUF1669 domain-containing protein [Clostridium botulinum]NFB05095.1 DUF1669 domain-containing protein [Clostridium botulinum]